MDDNESRLISQRRQVVDKILLLTEMFECCKVVDDWYEAMVCSYRIRASLYCYHKIINKMHGCE